MSAGRVVVIMGSKSDLEYARRITALLDVWRVPYALRVASAHKSAQYLLNMLQEYHRGNELLIFVTVAGRSNALSGMVDANTPYPVIACPPPSSSYGGADIYSSLRMPSGVAPLVVLEPENAALAAAKLLALTDSDLRECITRYQGEMTKAVLEADESLR